MKRHSGFTLMELMIVIAILGLLASIAIPSYQQQLLKSRRSDARAGLLLMADLEEKWYLQNNSYSAVATDVGGGLGASPEGFYDLSVTINGGVYTLTATPSAGSPQLNDSLCDGTTAANTITLTSAGQKTPAACWN